MAGQITGVEGYTESAAIGLLAGRSAANFLLDRAFVMPPANTVLGALHRYVTLGGLGDFAPMNANLGLLPPLKRAKGESKKDRKARQCFNAMTSFDTYLEQH